MRKIIACTLAILIVFVAYGHNIQVDSVTVYFTVNRTNYESQLSDNALSMNSFVDKLRTIVSEDELDHIDIYGYASPEGTQNANWRLSVKRCETIASYLSDSIGIDRDIITTIPKGVAWDKLRDIVANNNDVPYRNQILEILDSKSQQAARAGGDERKRRLMSLAGGRPYRWLLEHVFPDLRYSFAIVVYRKSPQPVVVEVENDIQVVDSVVVADECDSLAMDVACPDIHIADEIPTISEEKAAEPVAMDENVPPRHILALKTNMLYYAALLPNIELEWLITDNWSVAAEGNVAWWSNDAQYKSYRLAIIDAEVRRWINPRASWHGMYVGLLAGGGWYDLENGGLGYMGEGFMAGMSFGYMWPIGRNLSLEAGVGAGYMYTRFKEYEPFDGHLVYLRTKAFSYVGPLKLKFSLAWRFFDVNKPKRIKSGI